MRMIGTAALVIGLGAAFAAKAAVVDAQPSGFQVEEKTEIAASSATVWAALGRFGAWWDGQHSWSGDATNFALDLSAGGCLCEKLPQGGGVRHMTVVYAAPGKQAVLEGALGPLMFSGAVGRLVWTLSEKDGRTTLTQDYYVGGYRPGGLDKHAAAVDGVLGAQLGRLKTYVESGKPG
jgi:hypothetical protein